jgi:hypothetical protein
VESILGPRGTAAMYFTIIPVPGDCEDGEFCGIKIGRGTEVFGENLPRRHFVHHKSHLPNPGRHRGEPATNRFSYSAAINNISTTLQWNENAKELWGEITLFFSEK